MKFVELLSDGINSDHWLQFLAYLVDQSEMSLLSNIPTPMRQILKTHFDPINVKSHIFQLYLQSDGY